MTTINHGTWTRYNRDTMPDAFRADGATTPPAALGMNIMFCKRDDGIDWYDFIYTKGALAEGSIKMTVCNGIVYAVTRDASRLFPQNCRVVEVIGDDAPDPQAKYGGKHYDAKTNSFSDPPPPPPPPADSIAELIKRIEALESK